MDNVEFLTEYSLIGGSFRGQDYILKFGQGYTLTCEYLHGNSEDRTGTGDVYDDMVIMIWDDGETDETLVSGKTLWLSSANETLETPGKS